MELSTLHRRAIRLLCFLPAHVTVKKYIMVSPIITKNLFGKPKKNTPLLDTSKYHPFNITVSNGAPGKSVAYGPGSIIHGQISLQLPQRTQAYCVRVVFRCDEINGKKHTRMSMDTTHRNCNPDTPLFEIDSVVWGKVKEAQDVQELSAARHLFLFSIKLPMVNYPPSLNDSSVDHKVNYTLQGFFDLPGSQAPGSPSFMTERTAPISICFLPLVSSLTTREPACCETWRSASGEPLISITGELGRPACCPGDVCTVKLSVVNKSDHKISALHVSLISSMDLHAHVPPTTFINGDQLVTISTSHSTSALPIKRRTSTLHSEISHVAIPRNTQTPHNVTLRFPLPTTVLPTVTLDVGRSFDIHYDVVITVPLGSASASAFWSFSSTPSSPSSSSSNLPATASAPSSSKSNILSLTLPLTIATVPSNHPTSFGPIPSFLENPQLPTFIKNDSSSDSAPSSPISPISPWAETPSEELPDSVEHNPFEVQMVPADANELDPDLRNQPPRQDAAGYLLPPQKVRHSQHHKRSAGDASGVVTGTMEVPTLVVGGEPEAVVVG